MVVQKSVSTCVSYVTYFVSASVGRGRSSAGPASEHKSLHQYPKMQNTAISIGVEEIMKPGTCLIWGRLKTPGHIWCSFHIIILISRLCCWMNVYYIGAPQGNRISYFVHSHGISPNRIWGFIFLKRKWNKQTICWLKFLNPFEVFEINAINAIMLGPGKQWRAASFRSKWPRSGNGQNPVSYMRSGRNRSYGFIVEEQIWARLSRLTHSADRAYSTDTVATSRVPGCTFRYI